MIVVAKKLSVLQLFISRMPKMCAILQLVSAPLNPIYHCIYVLSVTVLTLWVAPPEMFCNWYRI